MSCTTASDLDGPDKQSLVQRRPSYIFWKERLRANEKALKRLSEDGDEFPHQGKIDTYGNTLSWLRTELEDMRRQDELFCTTFLGLLQELKEARLMRSCAEHKERIQDAVDEREEERDMLGELSVDYLPEQLDPELKQMGLTKMHMESRRFSIF